jgi:magnesium-transporting ATPase (P-type)
VKKDANFIAEWKEVKQVQLTIDDKKDDKKEDKKPEHKEEHKDDKNKSKDEKEKEKKEAALTEKNMIYMGCTIQDGNGKGIVVKTGMKT